MNSSSRPSDRDEQVAARDRQLRAERDYYRRRWIMHGISWRGFDWPKNALGALAQARTEDA